MVRMCEKNCYNTSDNKDLKCELCLSAQNQGQKAIPPEWVDYYMAKFQRPKYGRI